MHCDVWLNAVVIMNRQIEIDRMTLFEKLFDFEFFIELFKINNGLIF
jgi:hypothetical protein